MKYVKILKSYYDIEVKDYLLSDQVVKMADDRASYIISKGFGIEVDLFNKDDTKEQKMKKIADEIINNDLEIKMPSKETKEIKKKKR